MFILARGGETYARLALHAGPGGELLLPVEIDFSQPFRASQEQQWEQEYLQSVSEECLFRPREEEKLLRKTSADTLDRDVLADDEWMDNPFLSSDRWEVAGERF